VEEQARKMGSVADEVFLFVPADIRIPFAVQEIMFDRIVIEHTDHEILSNIAEGMGVEPVSFIMEYSEGPSFSSLDAAVEHCFDLYGVPEGKKELVAEYLTSAISRKDGQYAIGDSRNVGVIWWQNS
jgi:hypothetical protein